MSWVADLIGNLVGALHTAGWFSKSLPDSPQEASSTPVPVVEFEPTPYEFWRLPQAPTPEARKGSTSRFSATGRPGGRQELDAVRELAVVWAALQYGLMDGADAVEVAVQLLVQGETDLAVAALAGIPRGQIPSEARGQLEDALRVLCVEVPLAPSVTETLAFAALADDLRSELITPRRAAQIAHRVFGHDALTEPVATVVELDDAYDLIGYGLTDYETTDEIEATLAAALDRAHLLEAEVISQLTSTQISEIVMTGWTVPNGLATEVVRESLRRGSTLAEALLSRRIEVTAAHLCMSETQFDGDIPIVDIDRGYWIPYDRSIGAAILAQMASQSVAAVVEDTLGRRGDPLLDHPAGIIGPLHHGDRVLWGCALETADDAAFLADNLRWMTNGYPTNVLIVNDGLSHLTQGSEVDRRWVETVAAHSVGVMIGVFDEECYLIAEIA